MSESIIAIFAMGWIAGIVTMIIIMGVWGND